MRRIARGFLLATSVVFLWGSTGSASHPDASVALYDPAPSHLWNRLYASLRIRTDEHGSVYGQDTLDPLLWTETEHLLSQPSHQVAIRALDEFARTHGETLVQDPVRKAMLQHDLWAIFDWSVGQFSANGRPAYTKEKQELQSQLATVLRNLALTSDEVKALPDNYAQAVASGAFAREFDPARPDRPFLPPDLFDPKGPWVCIHPSPESETGVAGTHLSTVAGRSTFLVFVRLPAGRKATMDYFQALWSFPQPYVEGPPSAPGQAEINPDLPSFPAGTEVALVRRMTVFDNQANLIPSHITESVQIRVYHTITSAREHEAGGNVSETTRNSGQTFYEMMLSRALLFAGENGGLRAIGPEDREFSTFQSMGFDPFEESHNRNAPRQLESFELQRCIWCHSGGGIRSLNSRGSLLRPNRMQKEAENPDYGPIYWNESAAFIWKQNRFDWGLLNGYWKAATAH